MKAIILAFFSIVTVHYRHHISEIGLTVVVVLGERLSESPVLCIYRQLLIVCFGAWQQRGLAHISRRLEET